MDWFGATARRIAFIRRVMGRANLGRRAVGRREAGGFPGGSLAVLPLGRGLGDLAVGLAGAECRSEPWSASQRATREAKVGGSLGHATTSSKSGIQRTSIGQTAGARSAQDARRERVPLQTERAQTE